MRGQTYVITTIILVILIAVFAVMNVDSVDVRYFFWTVKSPLILVILFSVLMGGIVTATVGAVKIVHLQRENRALLTKNEKMTAILEKHQLLEESNEEKDKKNKKE